MRPRALTRLGRATAAGAVGLVAAGAAYTWMLRPRGNRWGATDEEVAREMPGDDIVPEPDFNATRAVTIHAPPEQVWPWIVQLGSGRAGWYTWDHIDNAGVPSAEHIIPELQQLAAGDLVPMVTGEETGVWVQAMEPQRWMIWWGSIERPRHPDGTARRMPDDGPEKGAYTWTWELRQVGPRTTRLITRLRGTYPSLRSGKVPYVVLASIADPVMMRKCMMGIKSRAEGSPGGRRASPDPLLDRFMPEFDIVEHHETAVEADARATWDVVRGLDLFGSPLVRAIFRGREILMGGDAPEREPRAFIADASRIGWGLLEELPGRQLVFGAVTRPWEANPVFRALPPEEFAAFAEPGYVKIAWTLRVEPIGDAASCFATQTRALATDRASRAKFRRYWRMVSPGVRLIRTEMLRLVRREAARALAVR